MLSLRTEKTRVIGHRGAMGHAPENTFASFEKGLALGADIVELDVHLSADDHLIVIHDPTVDRTTNGHGNVRALTLSQLKALDAGVKYGANFAGERIPTLEEVLVWAKGRVPIAIEIKGGPAPYPGIVERVVTLLEEHGVLDGAMVISFDQQAVAEAKRRQPNVATGVLYARPLRSPVAVAQSLGADALLPHWRLATQAVVAAAHRAGLACCPWVADEPDLMRRLVALGVDAIATNYPDRLRQVLAA